MRVLVLLGGRSSEHEISLLSGCFVATSLAAAGHEVVPVGIDREGRWFHLEGLPATRDPRTIALTDRAGPRAWLRPEPTGFLERAGAPPLDIDVVFPVLHGPHGEDGTVQGLLELCAVPYVGSGVTASAACMDKSVQRALCRAAGLPLLDDITVDRQAFHNDPDTVRHRIRDTLRRSGDANVPLFVKPACMGSSVGISRVTDDAALGPALETAFAYGDRVVVERGLVGPREIELAVLEHPDGRVEVSPPGEIGVHHPDGFYSYAAKYLDADGATRTIPAALDPGLAHAARALAHRAFAAMGCRGLARVDLFVDGDQLYLNEVNTMPGFTPISMYPALWAAAGIDGPTLVDTLVRTATVRRVTGSHLIMG